MRSSALEDAQAKVDHLLEVQRKLHAVLNDAPLTAGTGESAGVRNLLGHAVRAQTEQQRELDALRDTLREERCLVFSSAQQAKAAATELAAVREQAARLQAELDKERSERMESESAALEREEALQAQVDEMEEKERRRVQLAEEFARVEALAGPPMPAPSITVAAPPPPPPAAAGFDVSAGGFSL